jgi:cation transport protein ChaC
MTPQAFMHLPELEGRITPPEASGLRLTDEVLAAWDAQARAQGLPDDWRLPDADVERSRQAVLADIGGEDLWVFGYGSLMWNPGIHFQEVRRASLDGFARRLPWPPRLGVARPIAPAWC